MINFRLIYVAKIKKGLRERGGATINLRLTFLPVALSHRLLASVGLDIEVIVVAGPIYGDRLDRLHTHLWLCAMPSLPSGFALAQMLSTMLLRLCPVEERFEVPLVS